MQSGVCAEDSGLTEHMRDQFCLVEGHLLSTTQVKSEGIH